MQTAAFTLEFNQIKERLCKLAVSQEGRTLLGELAPLPSLGLCREKLRETDDARRILDAFGPPPLSAMGEMADVLDLAGKGAMLTAGQLESVAVFLASCRRTRQHLQRAEQLDVPLAYYGRGLDELSALREEIEAAVQGDRVLDAASPTLRALRRKIETQSGQIKEKLNALLRSRKQMFTDGYVSVRNGRYVLPVKKEYKHQIQGSVVEVSGTGGTCFMEPTAARRLQEEINALHIEEDGEVRKVLYTLSALVDDAAPALRLNMEAMTTLDVAFAKAKLSAAMDGIAPQLSPERALVLESARHPLLDPASCVPLDCRLGEGIRGIVVTGPNTGGKTVALKTVGLFALMAQSGLHVPARRAVLPLCDQILCDIGDGQSITENLSTFSAHITNIIAILQAATVDSLVLLDELGSGTDPAEGMGLAVAILEELRVRGCLFVATTHYPEVKDYAAQTPGLLNARMSFDRDSLQPLYRLELGEAGESCALYIAQRLGFPAELLTLARAAVDGHLPDGTAPAAQSLLREEHIPASPAQIHAYDLGDSVEVGPTGTLGIVYRPADSQGMVGVQIQGEKQLINHKRVKLKTPASELYPPDYDFSILFDSVAVRKARHQMERKFTKGLSVELEEG